MKVLHTYETIQIVERHDWWQFFPETSVEHAGRMKLQLLDSLLRRHTSSALLREGKLSLFEPLIGTGTILPPASNLNYQVVGCEHSPLWASVARSVRRSLIDSGMASDGQHQVFCGDSRRIPLTYQFRATMRRIPEPSLMVLSPPFPNSHPQGNSETQKHFKRSKSTYAGNDFKGGNEWGCGSSPNRAKWTQLLAEVVTPWIPFMRPRGLVIVHSKDFARRGARISVGEWVYEALDSVDIQGRSLRLLGREVVPLNQLSHGQQLQKGNRCKVVGWSGRTMKLECGQTKTLDLSRKDRPSKAVCPVCPNPNYVPIQNEDLVIFRVVQS